YRDGPHGLLYTLFSGVYRLAQYAKLYEQRFHAAGQQSLPPDETAVPQTLEELLEFALTITRQQSAIPTPDIRSSTPAIRMDASALDRAQVVWTGPLFSPSGYGEEIGQSARTHILQHFSREVVGAQMAREIERLRQAQSHNSMCMSPSPAVVEPPVEGAADKIS